MSNNKKSSDSNADLPLVGVRDNSKLHRNVWTQLLAFLSRKSPTTGYTYSLVLKEWCAFLGVRQGTQAAADRLVVADEADVAAYLYWLERRPGEIPRERRTHGMPSTIRSIERRQEVQAKRVKKSGLESTMANATVAKKFAALRRMYRVLQSCGFGPSVNPFSTDIVPPPPKDAGRKRPTRMLAFDRVKSLIESVSSDDPKGLRDKAILSALFGGALRRSEVAVLSVSDVRMTKSGTVFLYLRATKAKKDAEQALPKWAADVVWQLRDHRLQSGAKGADPLFLSHTGRGGTSPTVRAISASGVYKLFLHYCHAAGVEDSITPHSARATAITKLLAQGIPHRMVKEFSRHASIQMVELYDKRRIGVDENPAKDLDFE